MRGDFVFKTRFAENGDTVGDSIRIRLVLYCFLFQTTGNEVFSALRTIPLLHNNLEKKEFGLVTTSLAQALFFSDNLAAGIHPSLPENLITLS